MPSNWVAVASIVGASPSVPPTAWVDDASSMNAVRNAQGFCAESSASVETEKSWTSSDSSGPILMLTTSENVTWRLHTNLIRTSVIGFGAFGTWIDPLSCQARWKAESTASHSETKPASWRTVWVHLVTEGAAKLSKQSKLVWDTGLWAITTWLVFTRPNQTPAHVQ